jgi:hypothetical protein
VEDTRITLKTLPFRVRFEKCLKPEDEGDV